MYNRSSYGGKGSFSSVSTLEGEGEDKKAKGLSFMELMKVLKPFFWPDRGTDGALLNRIRAVSTYILIGISKVCSVFAPFFLKDATDALLKSDYDAAVEAIIWFCVLKFSTALFKELQGIMYLKVKQQATIELAETVYTHIHNLSLHWHLSKKTGNTVRVMDRGFQSSDLIVTRMFLSLIPALAECLAVVVLFLAKYGSPALGLTVFVGTFLYSVSTVLVTKYRNKLKTKANAKDNLYHELAVDSLLNYETVKYFTNENHEVSKYTTAVARYQEYNRLIMFSLGGLNSMQQFIQYVTLACVMIISASAVIDGRQTVGDFVAIYSWVITIFTPLFFLGTIYSMVLNALVDMTNLSEVLNTPPQLVDEPNAPTIQTTWTKPTAAIGTDTGTGTGTVGTTASDIDMAIDDVEKGLELVATSKTSKWGHPSRGALVEFREVRFNYPTQPESNGLKGISFTVHPGTTTAIVGSTGAGKTTISRLLTRFYDPVSGSVSINGTDIKTVQQTSVRGAIGVVPQDIVLFNDTILQNISYGDLNAPFEKVKEAAAAAQILDFIEGLPKKWETPVGERGLKLSGGEKQRVGIARCLLKNPPIVLFDEATSALDTETEHSIQKALSALAQNRTVLVIAHRLSTIAAANEIIVLEEGNITERGQHKELSLRPDGRYNQLWAMQIKANEIADDDGGGGASDGAADDAS